MSKFCSMWPARRLARWVLGLAALASAALPARAGLVTGNWDPAFGSVLPGLGWQVQAQFLVPDACSAQGDGVFTTSASAGDPCFRGDIVVQHVWLRLFDIGIADPNDFFTVTANSVTVDVQAAAPIGYGISKVRVDSGQVTGIEAGRADTLFDLGIVSTPVLLPTVVPPSAQGNTFGLTFGINGPQLFCYVCQTAAGEPGEPGETGETVYSSVSGLQQYLVSYLGNDTSKPKATDANGNALGAALDAKGVFLGLRTADGVFVNTVPEPPMLAITGLALLAAAAARRRSRA